MVVETYVSDIKPQKSLNVGLDIQIVHVGVRLVMYGWIEKQA